MILKNLKKYCILFILTVTSINCNKNSGSWQPLYNSPGDGFYKLFNGNDFTGWDIEPDHGAWFVQDSQMKCKGTPRKPYLIRTVKEYENFEFYAEFQISKDCNSGIFYHIPLKGSGRESKLGFETQILDDYGQPPSIGSSGSIYSQIAPTVNAMFPAGEWNQYHVYFDWPQCKVWLNGILVQDANFTEYEHLRHRLRIGAIGLSNHGHIVNYRNLWIKELPGKLESINLFNGTDLSNWDKTGNADWHVQDDMIVATKGEGYLVSKDAFSDYQLLAYFNNDTLQTRKGCFYYRWRNQNDPGYAVEFYNFPLHQNLREQYGEKLTGPLFWYEWLPYQIMSRNTLSQVRIAGTIISTNSNLNKVGNGKIAIYHHPDDGVIKIKGLKIIPLKDLEI